MTTLPTKQQLQETLLAAGKSHHEFQENFLEGVWHKQWYIWYAAFVLGRLGNFTTPTLLTQWIMEISDKEKWFKKTAEHILNKLDTA